MDAYKRYTLCLVCLVFAQMLILLATSFYLEPLVGDETRLGGYAENDFGWNQPQQVFENEAPKLRTAYDQYADIWVVGDSFSFAGNYGVLNYPWQTFLTAETGLSVASISHYTKTQPLAYDPGIIPGIVNSEAFQKTPPRVLIVEVVERQLDILRDVGGDCQPHYGFTQNPHLTLNPIPSLIPSKQALRKKTLPPFKEQSAYAKKYLGTFFQSTDDERIVYRLGLTTPRLFSNARSDELLAFGGDIKKSSWDEKKLADIRCKWINMQNLVQKNGKTLFVSMIVPDKLTAYARYLQDQSLAKISPIERLAADKFLHVVRLDQAIQASIDQGAVDVYLPNDTHWAYRGHQIAAATLARYLGSFSGD